jgi:hypothetical protein
MSAVSLNYEDFAALCDEMLGGLSDGPQRVPRPCKGMRSGTERFRGRWCRVSGGLAPAGRFRLRCRLGFPRGRR